MMTMTLRKFQQKNEFFNALMNNAESHFKVGKLPKDSNIPEGNFVLNIQIDGQTDTYIRDVEDFKHFPMSTKVSVGIADDDFVEDEVSCCDDEEEEDFDEAKIIRDLKHSNWAWKKLYKTLQTFKYFTLCLDYGEVKDYDDEEYGEEHDDDDAEHDDDDAEHDDDDAEHDDDDCDNYENVTMSQTLTFQFRLCKQTNTIHVKLDSGFYSF